MKKSKYYELISSDGKRLNFFETEKEVKLIEMSEDEYVKSKYEMFKRHAELMKRSMEK